MIRCMAKKSKDRRSIETFVIPNHPLAEVFGFPCNNHSAEADRYRTKRLCPFNNKVPNCTKDKANNPLGSCSIFDGSDIAITCPIRFRQGWIIADDAAEFFFPSKALWTSLTEVRLKDKHGGSAGNIDIVLVSYDDRGRITDFGSLEVQAVYISGNVRRPFEKYMDSPQKNADMNWCSEINYPHADYLSSSRKRLAPQLLYKGGIINAWGKKSAVALNSRFFRTLPKLKQVSQDKAEIAWLIYDLIHEPSTSIFKLTLVDTVFTPFNSALATLTNSDPGEMNDFILALQERLDKKLDDENPPDAPTLDQIIGEGN